jgi:hypothetical protein
MSSSKPIIVFVPGAWHTPEGFTPLITLLSIANYSCIPITLPSINAHPGHPDFSQDVAAIRNTVTTLSDAGKDVVVVMHSNGSVPGSESLLHLSRSERQKEGKNGGVIRVVYIGILLPKAGKTMYETFTEAMQSPDLDPDYVKDENEDFHVVAQVCFQINGMRGRKEERKKERRLMKKSGRHFNYYRWCDEIL